MSASPKVYYCKHCDFETGFRKKIRAHVQKIHNITSNHNDSKSAVSESYVSKALWEESERRGP